MASAGKFLVRLWLAAVFLASTSGFTPTNVLPGLRSAGKMICELRGSAISRKLHGTSSLRMLDSSAQEQCTGPAREGAVGNVDVSLAKQPAEEIKSDGIITLTENAKKQLKALQGSQGNQELVLRVGVRSGGCSGMSYVMEFEDSSKIDPMDTELQFDGCRVVVDPKSLMFVFGMSLDYSNALIGGGFKFNNPNAQSTCGCGQSFGA